MNPVNIYTYTTIKGPQWQQGAYEYVLEMETKAGPVTLTAGGILEKETAYRAQMIVLTEALKRMRRDCAITIYLDMPYIAKAIEWEWPTKWKKTGWKKRNGQPVANREEWEKLLELLERHDCYFIVGQAHPYKEWMIRETEKRRKNLEEMKNIEEMKNEKHIAG